MKKKWIWMAATAAVAALSALTAVAPYAWPGESARLMALWKGLDTASWNPYPVARLFAALSGYGNIAGALALIVSAVAIFAVTGGFVKSCVRRGSTVHDAAAAGNIAGAFAALAFVFAPGTIDAATHLEPALIDGMCALLIAWLFRIHKRLPPKARMLPAAVAGFATGAAMADTCFFAALVPFYIAAAWIADKRAEGKGYTAALVFVAAATIAIFTYATGAVGSFDEYVKHQKDILNAATAMRGWVVIPLFALAPFVAATFAGANAFRQDRGIVDLSFHAMLAFASILAIATPLSPSAVLAPAGVFPVLSTIAAACTAGYTVAYWWTATRLSHTADANAKKPASRAMTNAAKCMGWAAGGGLAAILAFSATVNRCFSFDASKGAFADEVARRIVAALDGRDWMVTDGTIDSHILLEADKAGKKVHLVNLVRESDDAYIASLADAVESEKLGGAACGELAELLRKYNGSGLARQKLVPFIQKWFGGDRDVAKKAAVFGAPDLWLYARVEPVPEQIFFGGDKSKAFEWKDFSEFDALLAAPSKGWGSHTLYDFRSARSMTMLDRRRLGLRRHMGFLATDAGYALQEKGRKLQIAGNEQEAQKLYGRAFDIYELVLGTIDADNLSAIFNELELIACGCAKARPKTKALNAKLQKIKEDENWRYSMGDIGLLYGYICNTDIMMRYGLSLLRSTGRQGEGLNQIKRALQFVPEEDRKAAELRLLAGYYAAGREKEKARKMYFDALAENADNREALLGLARLALMDGDTAKAEEYLKRATAGDDARAMRIPLATLHLVKNELDEAKALLVQATDENPSDIDAWSMYIAVNLRMIAALEKSADATAAAAKKQLETEIDTLALPAIQKHAGGPNDFRLQSAKAMVLMSRGGEQNIREARDAFIVAAKSRPDVAATSDMILDLDIRLNDTEDAERQARETLAKDKTDPLANYVMGSLALQKDRMEEAEAHLRLASDCAKPVPLALNDLAETLRRTKKLGEAEKYARRAVEAAPGLYVAWETLGSILLDAGKDAGEAEKCIQKACDMSRDPKGEVADIRMLMTLARVQIKNGSKLKAKSNLGLVRKRVNELTEFERREFEELLKSAK